MDVFCERLKLGSTAALDCQTGQNKGRYCKKELSFLLVSLIGSKEPAHRGIFKRISIFLTISNEAKRSTYLFFGSLKKHNASF